MNSQLSTFNFQLTIGWLYPELMSTYGDRGNIIVLQKRCEWRGITVEVLNIDQKTSDQKLMTIDLLFGGGAQDREQEIVMHDLRKKGKEIKELIEKNVPALFVCGAPQLMGRYYEPAEGKRIEGLGIFDMVSVHPGQNKPRLIGNIVAEVYWKNLQYDVIAIRQSDEKQSSQVFKTGTGLPRRSSLTPRNDNNVMVGFENHGGRTYLGKDAKPFTKVIKGFGNNGEDGTEGVVYKNAIGTYLHGPLLPKNPHIADYVIQKALEIKYKEKMLLKSLDDTLEKKANKSILKRLGVDF